MTLLNLLTGLPAPRPIVIVVFAACSSNPRAGVIDCTRAVGGVVGCR